ncbi:uncharacterized protein LOC134530667 isoform X3 [Bacillus rossius redtenbacheri]|uniref:uncharacterized protein LOC134530667 isoform X3 n=1 Tax=Bacillus rossius redtenbacheri TaxID=93214 RepID=UPI002FDE5A1F
MAAATSRLMGAELQLLEFVRDVYGELQKDVQVASEAAERQETQYSEKLRADMSYACDVLRPLLEGTAFSRSAEEEKDPVLLQAEKEAKESATARKPRPQPAQCSKKMTEYEDLSIKDLAYLVLDDAFPANGSDTDITKKKKEDPCEAQKKEPARPKQDSGKAPPTAVGPKSPAEQNESSSVKSTSSTVVNVSLNTNGVNVHVTTEIREGPMPPSSAQANPASEACNPPKRPPVNSCDSNKKPVCSCSVKPKPEVAPTVPAPDPDPQPLKAAPTADTQCIGSLNRRSPANGAGTTKVATQNRITVPETGLRTNGAQGCCKPSTGKKNGTNVRTTISETETTVTTIFIPKGNTAGAPPLKQDRDRQRCDDPAKASAQVSGLGSACGPNKAEAGLPDQTKNGTKKVKYVMHQAPSPTGSHPTLNKGQEFVHGFVPRPPGSGLQDDPTETVLSRIQPGNITDEWDAAQKHLKECKSCSRFLNPLLRKVGMNLVSLPCGNGNGSGQPAQVVPAAIEPARATGGCGVNGGNGGNGGAASRGAGKGGLTRVTTTTTTSKTITTTKANCGAPGSSAASALQVPPGRRPDASNQAAPGPPGPPGPPAQPAGARQGDRPKCCPPCDAKRRAQQQMQQPPAMPPNGPPAETPEQAEEDKCCCPRAVPIQFPFMRQMPPPPCPPQECDGLRLQLTQQQKPFPEKPPCLPTSEQQKPPYACPDESQTPTTPQPAITGLCDARQPGGQRRVETGVQGAENSQVSQQGRMSPEQQQLSDCCMDDTTQPPGVAQEGGRTQQSSQSQRSSNRVQVTVTSTQEEETFTIRGPRELVNQHPLSKIAQGQMSPEGVQGNSGQPMTSGAQKSSFEPPLQDCGGPQQGQDQQQIPPVQPQNGDLPPMFGYRGINGSQSPAAQAPGRGAEMTCQDPGAQPVSGMPQQQEPEPKFWCCEDCNCFMTADDWPQQESQPEGSIPADSAPPGLQIPSQPGEYAVSPEPSDQDCVLEPFEDKFQFTDEQLEKVFPEKMQPEEPEFPWAAVAAESAEAAGTAGTAGVAGTAGAAGSAWSAEAAGTAGATGAVGMSGAAGAEDGESCTMETRVDKVVSRRELSMVGNVKTSSLSELSQLAEYQDEELIAKFRELCDTNDFEFFQCTCETQDTTVQTFRFKKGVGGDAQFSGTDTEAQGTSVDEHESCHLLCWDRKQDPQLSCPPKPLTKEESSCMVLCWGDPPTDTASGVTSDDGCADFSDGGQDLAPSCQLLCWEVAGREGRKPRRCRSLASVASSCAVLCWADLPSREPSDVACGLLCWKANMTKVRKTLSPLPSLASVATCDVFCWSEDPELARKLDCSGVKPAKTPTSEGELTADDICRGVVHGIISSLAGSPEEDVRDIIYQLITDITGGREAEVKKPTHDDSNNVIENTVENVNGDGNGGGDENSSDNNQNGNSETQPANEDDESVNVYHVMRVDVLAGPEHNSLMLSPAPLHFKKSPGKEPLKQQDANPCEENYKEELANDVLRKIHSKIMAFHEPVIKTMEAPPGRVAKSDDTIIAEIITALQQLAGNKLEEPREQRDTEKTSKENVDCKLESKHQEPADERKVAVKPTLRKQVQLKKSVQFLQSNMFDITTFEMKQNYSTQQDISAPVGVEMNSKQEVQKSAAKVLMLMEPVRRIQTTSSKYEAGSLDFISTNVTTSTGELAWEDKPISQCYKTALEENEAGNFELENVCLDSTSKDKVLVRNRAQKKRHKCSKTQETRSKNIASTKDSGSSISFHRSRKQLPLLDDAGLHFCLHTRKDVRHRCSKSKFSDSDTLSSESKSSGCGILCWNNCKHAQLLEHQGSKAAPTEKTFPLRKKKPRKELSSLQNCDRQKCGHVPKDASNMEPPCKTVNAAAASVLPVGAQECNHLAGNDPDEKAEESAKREVPRTLPTGLNILLPIGNSNLLLGWDKLTAQDSHVAGFEVHVNNRFHQKIHSSKRNRTLLERLDLSKKLKISMHAVSKEGKALGTPARIIYQP